jgi:hypothetical protein
MKQKVITYALMLIVILLSIQLFGNNRDFKKFKQQIARFEKSELLYQEEINEKGERIIEQQQVILTQSDAIEQGLLEIDRLKRVNSQVHIVTNTVIDTILISHVDTVVQLINGNSYLKLPQDYSFSDEFLNFSANVNTHGLSVDNISVFNEGTITIGYKRQGLFKPMIPVVEVKNTNPYMKTSQVRNVVIEPEYRWYDDKKVWGAFGLLIGLTLK